MDIPHGPQGTEAEGFPTLYTSRIRAYGAGDLFLADQESERGCPRLYRMRYVEKAAPQAQSEPLAYGSVIHEAMRIMEEEACGPEPALMRAWDPVLGPERMAEAVEDLDNYLARGSAAMNLGTVATEQELVAKLYDDEVYGPVYFAGFIDWLGLDVNDPTTLHLTDYKTDRRPRARASLKGDVQLRSYDWLVRQNWSRYMTTERPQVIVHLDQIKFHDLDWWYSEQEIEEWHAWAVAIARRILRDEAGDPVLGPQCTWCPVKMDCPAFKRLPGQGLGIMERRVVAELPQLVAWKHEASATIKLLKEGVDEVNAILRERVVADGGVVTIGDTDYCLEDREENRPVVRAVHDVLDDRFYDIATVSLKALEDVSRGDPQLRDKLMACVTKEVVGDKIVPRKHEEPA